MIDSEIHLAVCTAVAGCARYDLVLRESSVPLAPASSTPALFEVDLPDAGNVLKYRILSAGGNWVLRFEGLLEFSVSPSTVLFYRVPSVSDDLVASYFVTCAFSMWLGLKGYPVLHGSAVRVGSGTAAFLGDSGAGKSVMASAFRAAGCAIVTDDLVVVQERNGHYELRVAQQSLRLRPDATTFFWGEAGDWPLADPGYSKRLVSPSPVGGIRPAERLDRLYVLQRDPQLLKVELNDLAGPDALRELVRYTLAPRTAAAAGLQAERLGAFARMVATVPVRRLRYPSGFEHLAKVRDAVLADVRADVREAPIEASTA